MENALKALSMIDDEESSYGTILSVSGPGKKTFFSFSFFLFSFLLFDSHHVLFPFFPVVIAEKMAGSAMYELVSAAAAAFFCDVEGVI